VQGKERLVGVAVEYVTGRELPRHLEIEGIVAESQHIVGAEAQRCPGQRPAEPGQANAVHRCLRYLGKGAARAEHRQRAQALRPGGQAAGELIAACAHTELAQLRPY
jgi:hypothetical protein